MSEFSKKEVKILLVEDNPGDVKLTQRAFKKSRFMINMDVVVDGEEALAYIYKEGKYSEVETPDLILLDLNLPKISGFEVLEKIKSDDTKVHIPVAVLTTSEADVDIVKAYGKYANCFLTKPMDFYKFKELIALLDDFWFTIVKLPSNK